MLRPFITIDPGIEAGWAVWKLSECGGLTPPFAYGGWTGGTGDWLSLTRAQGLHWEQLFSHYCPTKVFCEEPKLHEGFAGMTVARSGALVKLTYMVGVVGECARRAEASFELIPIAKWKGQLPKRIVIHRIQKLLPDWKPTKGTAEHVWDAVGIGLHLKGFFNA